MSLHNSNSYNVIRLRTNKFYKMRHFHRALLFSGITYFFLYKGFFWKTTLCKQYTVTASLISETQKYTPCCIKHALRLHPCTPTPELIFDFDC